MFDAISNYIDKITRGRKIRVNGKIAQWKKVKDLKAGMKIAVTLPKLQAGIDGASTDFDEIVSIKKVGREQVYDIEVEGTHNFVGNDIIAHNTYIQNTSTAALNVGNFFDVDTTNSRVGIGTTAPVATLDVNGVGAFGNGAVSAPGIAFRGDLDNGLYYLTTDTWAAAAGGANALTFNTTGVGIGTTAPAYKLDLVSTASTGTGAQFSFNSLTSGTGFNVTSSGAITGTLAQFTGSGLTTGTGIGGTFNALTTGKGLYLSSTSTALTTGSLLALDWSPGSSTTATGDLFSLNIGANGTIGNILNITDAGSSLFSVSESAITSAIPHAFTAAGDVTMAYDLNFSNQTSANITSLGPLSIKAGENFESNNLTLQTYNSGDLVLDLAGGVTFGQAQAWDLADSSVTSLNIESGLLDIDTTNSRIGIGTSAPAGLLHAATSTTALGQTIFEQASADSDSWDLNFRKTRGTVASPTVITTADELGVINFRGYSGAGGYVTGAAIKAISEGTIATTRVPAHLSFWTGTDAAPTVLTERMRIDKAGNVGIGQTSPTAVLHLKAGTTAASTAPLKFASGSLMTTPEAGAVEFLTDAYYGTITTGAARRTFAFLESPSFTTPTLGAATATSIAIGANTLDTNEWANLDGINQTVATTSTPQFARLGVGAAAHATNILSAVSASTTDLSKGLDISHTGGITGTGYAGYFSKTGASTTNVGLYATATGATNNYAAIFEAGLVGIGTTAPGYALDVISTGTDIARFNGSGSTGCTLSDGGVIACSSDVNLKKNIEGLNYGLNEVLKLNPVEFNWKSEDNTISKSLGFIAQDVEKIFPKLVSTDASGYKQLNTVGMVPVLTKAIQELALKVDKQGSVMGANVLAPLDAEGYPSGTNTSNTTNMTDMSYMSYMSYNDKQIASIEARLTALETDRSSSTLGESIATPEVFPSLIASSEAVLAVADSLLGCNVVASDSDGDRCTLNSLLVSGKSNLSDLAVTGRADFGLLTISGMYNPGSVNPGVSEDLTPGLGSAINVLGTLYLQNEYGAGNLDVFDGKIVMTPEGNINIKGNITVEGSVTTRKLVIQNGDPSVILEGADSATPSSWSPDEGGAIGSQDSIPYQPSASRVQNDASIGSGLIEAGDTTVTIETTAITDSSKVFVTAKTLIDKPLVVTTTDPGKSFTVEISTAQSKDIKFDWWIVDEIETH